MTITASNIFNISSASAVNPPYYELSKKYASDNSAAPLNTIADAFKSMLGDTNIITGTYNGGTSTGQYGVSMIADCGNFRLLFGHGSSRYSIGITYDTPTYTTHWVNDDSFGSHINHVYIYHNITYRDYWAANLQCQIVKDSDTDTYYLITNNSATSAKHVVSYAFGSFGYSDRLFLLDLYQTGTDISGYNPELSSFSYNSMCLKKNSDGTIVSKPGIFCPWFLFDRTKTRGAVSGSTSTAKKYVSGIFIWDLASATESTEARELLAEVPPTKLGRISTYSGVSRGTMFNNYNNVVAVDNIVIPWTGSANDTFIV